MQHEIKAAGQVQKHERLIAAIDAVDEVNRRLDALSKRISGNMFVEKSAEDGNRKMPTLLSVLDDGSAILGEKCSKAHELISEIEGFLF